MMKSRTTKLMLASVIALSTMTNSAFAQNRDQKVKPFALSHDEAAKQMIIMSAELLATLGLQQITKAEANLLREIRNAQTGLNKLNNLPYPDQYRNFFDITRTQYIWVDSQNLAVNSAHANLDAGHRPISLDTEGNTVLSEKKHTTFKDYRATMRTEYSNRIAYLKEQLNRQNPKFGAFKLIRVAGTLMFALDLGARMHTIYNQQTSPGYMAIDDFLKPFSESNQE